MSKPTQGAERLLEAIFADDISCPTNEELGDFLTDDLDPQTEAEITRHLGKCEECATAVDIAYDEREEVH
jgi:hypothetical protein